MTLAGSIRRRTVAIEGTSTAFLDVGRGEPLVALHGIPTSSALFEPLLPFLSDYRLIAPDLLGQGETETPVSGSLGHAAYAAHLGRFLETVPPSPFHLLVHDLGGILGLEWACDHADRVTSIVILSTTVSWSPRVSIGLYAANILLGATPLRWAMRTTLKRRRQSVDAALLRAWARPWTRRRLLRGLDHFAAAHLRRLRAKLPRLRMPVRLIWGEDDTIFPLATTSHLMTQLPQARLLTIPRCGHWSPLDAPEAVAQHMVGFLQALRSPSTAV